MRFNWLKPYRFIVLIVGLLIFLSIANPIIFHFASHLHEVSSHGPLSKLSFNALYIILTVFAAMTYFAILKSILDDQQRSANLKNQGKPTPNNLTPVVRICRFIRQIRLRDRSQERRHYED